MADLLKGLAGLAVGAAIVCSLPTRLWMPAERATLQYLADASLQTVDESHRQFKVVLLHFECQDWETMISATNDIDHSMHHIKAKQRCVLGVGMCLYAQLVQTKNKWCKSAIMIQCYHPYLSDFCSRPQPHNVDIVVVVSE